MPTISLKKRLLFQALGREYTDEEFDELCFAFGLELDEVTTENKILQKERGEEITTSASDEIIFKIEIPANRYDLLCLEGLSRALLIFLNKLTIPKYNAVTPKSGPVQKLYVTQATQNIRPYVVAAILRDITFTQETYESLIDLQEKLHLNICRKRSLASIGIHNLDSIEGPFTYDARLPKDIRFRPLKETKEFTAEELMTYYKHNPHLKPYLPIILDKPLYPVIYDSKEVVVSLPPIINGDHSRLSSETKNIFIECTATDLNKASIVVDTIICLFSQYCAKPYIAEIVEVVYPSGKITITPELPYRQEIVSAKKVNERVGINESIENIASMLTKMCLKANVNENNQDVSLEVPPTRHDVIHECDIIEDVAIAYGYNNIAKLLPQTCAIGAQYGLNKLTDKLRESITQAGYTEVLTFSLCSTEDISNKIRKNLENSKAVHISNPKTLEFQVARTTLLPGLLKTINSNKKMPLPMKLFEISDVVLQDKTSDVGARNIRRLCAVYYSKTSGFEIIHGLLDRIMQLLEVPWSPSKDHKGYYIEACEDDTFFPGRCAEVIVYGSKIGSMGILHPEVLDNFDLNQPCSTLEIDIELFV